MKNTSCKHFMSRKQQFEEVTCSKTHKSTHKEQPHLTHNTDSSSTSALHEMNHSAEKARKKTFLKNLRFVEKEH